LVESLAEQRKKHQERIEQLKIHDLKEMVFLNFTYLLSYRGK